MTEFKLSKPVAFLIFNRPDKTKLVFEEIRRAKPPILLVVADGPRTEKSGEADKCSAARAIIEKVDWPCKVLTNYSEVNLGCKMRVSSGLDWVFRTVEEAIVLEDDCLPHADFFRFCDELLDKYRDDDRVMMISGFNFLQEDKKDPHSYFFSKYPHIWGWASWRRVWRNYDVEMRLWPVLRDSNRYYDFCGSINEASFWRNCFDSVYNGKVNTWDAQVTFMFFCQSGLSIFPHSNLISNIGFGADATHTLGHSNLAKLDTNSIEFPLVHPEMMIRDVDKDEKRRKREYLYMTYWGKIINRLVTIIGGQRH